MYKCISVVEVEVTSYECRSEVNEGTIKESDNTVGIYDENVDTNHADSANEKHIGLIESDPSDYEIDF